MSVEKLTDSRVLVALVALVTTIIVVFVPEFEKERAYIQENLEWLVLASGIGSVSTWAMFREWLVRDERNDDLFIEFSRRVMNEVDERLFGGAIPEGSKETALTILTKVIESVVAKALAEQNQQIAGMIATTQPVATVVISSDPLDPPTVSIPVEMEIKP